MKMSNYSITSVFIKIDSKWKVIHSHESALRPEIIKKDRKKSLPTKVLCKTLLPGDLTYSSLRRGHISGDAILCKLRI